MNKVAFLVIWVLIGFYSWIIYYSYTHKDNDQLDRMEKDVYDINAYITDLKVNWINVTITNK